MKLAACAEERGYVVEGADDYAEALWPIFFLDVDVVVSEDVGIYSVLGVVGGEERWLWRKLEVVSGLFFWALDLSLVL